MEDLQNRVIWLECAFKQLQEHCRAQQLVLGWLMAKQPGNEAMEFLSCQANELDDNPKFEEDVVLLDELREDVAQWRAQWTAAHKTPR